jgi:hypothetical protein
MIIERLTESQFINAFKSWDTYKNNFSYEGLKALYEYFEEVAECSDSGTYELDVVAICCEYTEYANWEEFVDDYGDTYDQVLGGDKLCLDYYTTVILPDCWQGKEDDERDLPFIIRQF